MKIEHFGFPGHFICGRWCRFHITTVVGEKYLISTIGEYVHPKNSGGSEKAELEYMAKNPNGEEIGHGRHYETMVFRAGKRCKAEGCNCGQPKICGDEIAFRGYNDPGSATQGHNELVAKYVGAVER